MTILALDTSAKAASAAVIRFDEHAASSGMDNASASAAQKEGFGHIFLPQHTAILAEGAVNVGLTHSQTILPMCDAILRSAQMTLDDIDGFAVSAGPGSFTGVRIGISAVKGMAVVGDKPVAGISTLEAIAYNLLGFEGIACAVMDARRQQVYNALFRLSGTDSIERLSPDRAILIDQLGEELKNFPSPIFLVGDGADLCYTVLSEFDGIRQKLRLAPLPLRLARAVSVGLAALPVFAEGRAVHANELLPAYLRLPQAERERLAQEKAAKKGE